jgi:phage tail sheath gpL-like
MTVPFNYIPAGNGVRVPLFYAEMDNSQANIYSAGNKTLLIGQKLTAGTATANVPVLVATEAQAITLFGRGSMLTRMLQKYRLNDPTGEVWAIPVPDDAGGVAATGSIVAAGPATANGTIALYVAGQRLSVGVTVGDTATTIGAAIAAAINAATDLPVTASAATGTVTLTCRWKGLTGNDIQHSHSYRGLAGGEALPAGVTLTHTAMSGGTTAPSLTAAIVAMGDEPYEFILHPYSDSSSLDDIDTELDDLSGRWSWSRQIYGHAYTVARGDLNGLVVIGSARNGKHQNVGEVDYDTQNPLWEIISAFGGATAVSISADPARPTQGLPLIGILPPREGKRFIWAERNVLLGYGISTFYVEGGYLRIERAITTYQENASGQEDISYLDSETLHQSAYVLRALKSAVTSKYGRHKLADDGTRFGPGSAIVTPAIVRGELYSIYKDLELLGIVENFDAFRANLIVERDAENPNRLNVLFPPDYVNQLRVFAVLNQFRLQY